MFSASLIDKDIQVVKPSYETPQVVSKGDAADDPAIWFNKSNPSKSLIFGTDKRSGVYTYNLNGEKVNYTELGNINNIDTRTINITDDDGLDLGPYSFIFASNRSLNSLDIWAFSDTNMNLAIDNNNFNLPKKPYIRAKSDVEVYGVCGGYDKTFGLIAFLTADGSSEIELWSYSSLGLTLLTTFKNGNAIQSEGCVYDDENRTLFISEENERGVVRAYKLNNGLSFDKPIIIDTREGNITGDPEGLAILKINKKDGYLIASSQGSSTFNIYQRHAPYNFINKFSVTSNKIIDGVSDTDGIDILNTYLNKDFPNGIIVVQDGENTGEQYISKENFKYLSLRDLIIKLDL